MPLQIKSPAKINWFLSVLKKREDGYHDISSLMQCVSLYDTLTFEDSAEIEVRGNADIPPEKNLIYKAAVLLKQRVSYKRGASVTFKKEIPVFAGLGGGSSNAAATLIGLNRMWGCRLSNKKLTDLCAELGSDVPFFLNGPFALVQGRGERVTALRTKSSHVLLLVKPPVNVSTKWAYANINELTKKANNIKLFCQVLDRKDFVLLSSVMKNDLEGPVFKRYPLIGELKGRLLDSGAHAALMTGSGAAVFGVFSNMRAAEKAAAKMAPYWCSVIKTINTVDK